MLIVISGSSIFVWIRGYTFNTISERIAKHLRYDLLLHLLNKDIAFYDLNKTGDLLSRLANDVTVVQNGLGTNISMFVRAMVTIISSIAVLCYISWELTLVTLAGIVPVCVLAAVYAFKIRALTKLQQDIKAELG
jgi:ATP-binding cassette, subfamily B, bacterial